MGKKKDGAKVAMINFQNKAIHYQLLNLRLVFGLQKNNFRSIVEAY